MLTFLSFVLFAVSVPQNFLNSTDFPVNPVARLSMSSTPLKNENPINLFLNSRAFFAYDFKSGTPLVAKNEQTRLPIASLTKIATAVTAMETYNLNDVLIVPANITTVQGSKMELWSGERISVRALLHGLLIVSANDAALVLAGNTSEKQAQFIEKMNAIATRLKLHNTHFSNSVGFDEAENYSTAYDLALLTKYFLQNPLLRQIVATKKITISSADNRIHHELKNINALLQSDPDFLGVKTGTSPAAGKSFVGLSKNARGQEIITVVLDSPARFEETETLAKWVWQAFRW